MRREGEEKEEGSSLGTKDKATPWLHSKNQCQIVGFPEKASEVGNRINIVLDVRIIRSFRCTIPWIIRNSLTCSCLGDWVKQSQWGPWAFNYWVAQLTLCESHWPWKPSWKGVLTWHLPLQSASLDDRKLSLDFRRTDLYIFSTQTPIYCERLYLSSTHNKLRECFTGK